MASNKEVGDPCQFDNLSVHELKIYLRDRGAHVSGNRPELIKRARGLVQIGKRTLKEINIQDNNNKLERQEELFTTPLGEKLPEPGSLKGCWEDDVLKIPFFRTQDLYNYLVLNRSRTFDNQNMNARKQLKAKVFYEDGHVHSVKYNQISHKCSHCYVRAKVILSLPGSDVQKKDYEPWACLAKVSGKIHAAGCNCAAGEGESCNHVAALLYALVDIGSKQKDGLNAPTSTKCKWNQPRKRKISPQRSQHLVFKKLKFENDTLQKVSPSTKCKVDNLHNVKPLNSLAFGEKLKKCAPHAAFLLSDSELVAPEEPIPVLHKLHSVDFFNKDSVDLKSSMCENNFETYFKSLNCKQDDCFLIENSTKGQHKSYHWKNARAGRLTSSSFGTICKKKPETKPDILLRSIMGYNDEFDTAATRWAEVMNQLPSVCTKGVFK
ncbi:uncharacterized protein LOC128219335 [Mya arenaria]|nr:uncharacterized protein LOC128219335 [Mya arenaria]